MAVQDPLRSVPYSPADDGIMVASLVILVFLAGVLSRLMIFEGFCVGILEFLITDKLTPNYVIIAYVFGKIPFP